MSVWNHTVNAVVFEVPKKMCLKEADGMANNVNPFQTAPVGGAVLSGSA